MRTTGFSIERLERDGDGILHALVLSGETAVELSDEYGSWMTPPLDERGTRREARPAVAAALQKHVRS